MQIRNYMEDMVSDALEELLVQKDDICKCQKCKLDMMVWALNRLPPKYAVSEKGRLFTKLEEEETQFKADVTRELTKAIVNINKNPRH
ncbi:MAG: late competence development ComFB family protein [Candidatus Omnitrophota bacterium]|nr:late competence development ComFB family protein [Candidatus Omnitrophota bacterium]MBU1929480.1 late competence development ComFB family protein [Candidatus Omnitrophota bacterium]MBU2034941.1 late competence development ComFB family protein [Candidatus Omnitrophota bacterium]MBU2258884.1 late competence development ComFB family protein [Candidatus Omnitrophota bacterium]